MPGIISGLPQGLAPYLSPQVDFRMVMMVRMMMMVMVMVMVRMVMVIGDGGDEVFADVAMVDL